MQSITANALQLQTLIYLYFDIYMLLLYVTTVVQMSRTQTLVKTHFLLHDMFFFLHLPASLED